MMEEARIYPCCSDPSCPYCLGSGIVSGPEYDAFMEALERIGREEATTDGD